MVKSAEWEINKSLRQRTEYNKQYRQYCRVVNEILSYTTKKAKTALYKSGLSYMPTNIEKNRLNRLIYLKKKKINLERLLHI